MTKPRIVRKPRTGDRDRWHVMLPCGCLAYFVGPNVWESMADFHRRMARDLERMQRAGMRCKGLAS